MADAADLLYAEIGERVWWTWGKDDVDSLFTLVQSEKCVSSVGNRPAIENELLGEPLYLLYGRKTLALFDT